MAEDKTRVIGSPDRKTDVLDTHGTGATVPGDSSGGDRLTTIPAGSLLIHTYRIERLLGSGGMGEVYLARHTELGTQHAIKVIHPALFENRQVLDLFRREATVLRAVRHDAVVSYDGFFSDEHGRNYLVMEYVEGPSLSDRLRRQPLTIKEALTLRDRLAGGLSEAHRKGAVHRDISPDNIILPDSRLVEAKLIDFGLCKLTDPTQKTIIGSDFAGKYHFASPEQLGLNGGGVDARSDIYSLGLVLAAATVGRPLDMGNSFDAVVRARKSIPDLTPLPAPLREQIAAMLEPDPDRRPRDLAEILRRWPSTGAGEGARLSKVRDESRPFEDHGKEGTGRGVRPRAVFGIGVLMLALLATVLYCTRPPSDPGLDDGNNQDERPDEPVPGSPPPLDELTGLPWDEIAPYFREYRARGLMNEAFTLLQGMAVNGHALPVDETYGFVQELMVLKRKDQAFALLRQLANGGHGPSALTLAGMYDPVIWTSETSAFSQSNARLAERWYRRALAQGMSEARARLDALEDWKRQGDLENEAL